MPAKLGTPVTYQQTEISDTNVSLVEAPAIVTSVGKLVRRKPNLPPPKPTPIGGVVPAPTPDELEEIEVVSLTVFRKGYIEYLDNVEQWRDELKNSAGANSYRDANSAQPKLK